MSIAPAPRAPQMTLCAYCGSPIPNHKTGCPVTTPQSREAAEGAGKRDWVNCPICDEPDMRCETFDEGATLIHCTNHSCPSNMRTAAPPKPAPDAMQPWEDIAEDDPDVVLAAHAIAEHGIGRPWDDFLPTNAYDVDHGDLIEYGRAAVAALRAKFSAPVPPADGTPKGRDAGIAEAIFDIEGGEAPPGIVWTKRREPPSGTGAAEPETDQQFEDRLFKQDAADMLRLIDYIADKIGLAHDEELSRDNFNAWLATPPIRENLEAVLRLLQASSCFRGEVCVSLPCACAESLSLPVQSTDRKTLYAILSKHIPQDMIDGIWQEWQEAIGEVKS